MIIQVVLGAGVAAVWLATLYRHTRPSPIPEPRWRNFQGNRTVITDSDGSGPLTWWVDPVGKRFDSAFLAVMFGLPSVLLTVAAVAIAPGSSPLFAWVAAGLAAGSGWLAAGIAADFLQPHRYRSGRRITVGDGQVLVGTYDGFASHEAAVEGGPLKLSEIHTLTHNPDEVLHFARGKAPTYEDVHLELRAGETLLASSRERTPIEAVATRVADVLGVKLQRINVERQR